MQYMSADGVVHWLPFERTPSLLSVLVFRTSHWNIWCTDTRTPSWTLLYNESVHIYAHGWTWKSRPAEMSAFYMQPNRGNWSLWWNPPDYGTGFHVCPTDINDKFSSCFFAMKLSYLVRMLFKKEKNNLKKKKNVAKSLLMRWCLISTVLCEKIMSPKKTQFLRRQ